ncbi:hypothetical protein TNCV_183341 [Trichonephila clavipes]|nr:hypothetical protein TNCV_183341 [Trichonephila clavipes]
MFFVYYSNILRYAIAQHQDNSGCGRLLFCGNDHHTCMLQLQVGNCCVFRLGPPPQPLDPEEPLFPPTSRMLRFAGRPPASDSRADRRR